MDTDSVDEVIVIRKKRKSSHDGSLGVMAKGKAKPRMTKPEPVKAPPPSSTPECNTFVVEESDDDNNSPPVQPELEPSIEDDDTVVKAQHSSDDPHYWQDAQPRDFWFN